METKATELQPMTQT